MLKTTLDRSVERSRGIADRVAKASLPGAQFALPVPGEAAVAQDAPVDVEGEMMALADEQLRFLATSRLLEKTYSSLRNAIKGGNG
jgi:hypothetical protein